MRARVLAHRPSPAAGAPADDARAAPANTGPAAHAPVAARPSRSSAAKPVARRPQVRERLHRLRRELAKIDPPPENVQAAWHEIVAALARAHLSGWTVPAPSDPAATRCTDGSVRIELVSHVVVINPWGAFRIDDKQAPRTPYFEMAGKNERAFVPPA